MKDTSRQNIPLGVAGFFMVFPPNSALIRAALCAAEVSRSAIVGSDSLK